jgi:hypothetical protein
VAGRSRAIQGFFGPISQAIGLIGQPAKFGVQPLINSDYRSEIETHDLMAAEVMPHFV